MKLLKSNIEDMSGQVTTGEEPIWEAICIKLLLWLELLFTV